MRFIETPNPFDIVPEFKLDMGDNVFYSLSGLSTAIQPLFRPFMIEQLERFKALNVMCCAEMEMYSPTKDITATFFFKSWCHKV